MHEREKRNFEAWDESMMSRTKMAEAIGGSECTRIYTS